MSEKNNEEELVDYEEDVGEEQAGGSFAEDEVKESKKGGYVGIHSSGFRDFVLKPEILRAVADCGFEHPSEVQQTCIPEAILGQDIICQAKSGMGKTAVFVLATLQQCTPEDGVVDTLVLCNTRELAYQICNEFERFSKYLPDIKTAVLFGGIGIAQHRDLLKNNTPHIIVGTPGRVLGLVKEKTLKLNNLKRFVMDECDQLLEGLDMRRDVQRIFQATPHAKQVLMFSATMSKEIRPVCEKFTQNANKIFIDDETKLTLHGIQQYYVNLTQSEKNRKLNDLLDSLEFNQVVIFVNGVRRCKELNKLLLECNFPSMCVYGGLKQEERIARYNSFKNYQSRILVATDLFGRGVDFERVNVVINYDVPKDADQYLHRVGRSGRFGTRGLSCTFVTADDKKIIDEVQSRFEVKILPLPDEIDHSTYMSG